MQPHKNAQGAELRTYLVSAASMFWINSMRYRYWEDLCLMRKTMNRIRATSVFTLEVANTILKQTLFGYKVV